MKHLSINEWGKVAIGNGEKAFTDAQASALLSAAREHPCANKHGTNILIDRRTFLYAQQVVGVIAAKGCSLEILPKVDSQDDKKEKDEPDQQKTARAQLVAMLDIAYKLNLSEGRQSTLATQNETLLEIFIRIFADKLLEQVRRGLARNYKEYEDDLPALRGRLNVTRQFTINAVRPDRLSCRFDQLDSDTPLMRIMAAAVLFLNPYCKNHETRRKLNELRFMLADIPIMPISKLPWKMVHINRSNLRWESLFNLAKLLLKKDWQTTQSHREAPDGVTLLFPMNDLFEAYIAALLRRVLNPIGVDVIEQGGRKYCLGDYSGNLLKDGIVFQTKPDIILRHGKKDLMIIDTKWKKLSDDVLNKKQGVSQSDVYQLMAYARLYKCKKLMLLYPSIPNELCGTRQEFGIAEGTERLSIATIDIAQSVSDLEKRLKSLMEKYNIPLEN